MFDKFFGGKPWFKSLTGWAILIFIMAQTAIPAASEVGIVSPEVTTVLNSYLEKFAFVLGALGIRRQLPANPVK